MKQVGAPTPSRRTRLIGLGALIALAATFTLSAPASSAEPFNKGTGTATALGYKVNPLFGNLSFGITAGVAIAGHQNTVAQGISKVFDLGVIGLTLAGEGCDGGDPTLAAEDQPQPLIAESRDKKYEDGVEQEEDWGGLPSGTKFARADGTPFAEAITEIAPMGDKQVAHVSGGRTIASSGVMNGNTREARAVTEIGEISFLNGLVKIGDMRWEAIQRTGAITNEVAEFEVGSLEIGGQKVPLPSDPVKQLATFNEALRSLGFQVTPPVTRFERGIVFVSPMKIGIIPSDIRESLVGPVFTQIQPYREALTKALLEQDCGNATYITILDIALGTFSGAGALNLELGGVQATTKEIVGFSGLGEFTPLPPVSLPPVVSNTGGNAGGSSTPDVTTADTTPADDDGGNESAPRRIVAAPINDLVGSRGGKLAAVSALGLLALLVSAELDRRKMRRALREIPLEV